MFSRLAVFGLIVPLLLIWSAGQKSLAQGINAGDALAQCKQKLGPGAIAEEELEFGETTYVCTCVSPYRWNEANTGCIGGNSSTAPETPDFTAPPDTGGSPVTEQLSAEQLFEKARKAVQRGDYKQAAILYDRATFLASKTTRPKRTIPTAPAMFTARQLFDKARNNYNSGDFVVAAFWYKKAAEKESVGAMINLGIMYRDGIGLPKRPEEAVRWFRQGVELGHPVAMFNLARMYQNGEGVPRNTRKAFQLNLKSANKGYPSAMAVVGYAYFYGTGNKRDNAKAARWLQKALDGGNINVVYPLGSLHDKGNGVRRDRKYAAQLVAQGLRAGDKLALKFLLRDGRAWSKPFWRELQRILKNEGVYDGAIDGAFGPATRRALKQLAGQ